MNAISNTGDEGGVSRKINTKVSYFDGVSPSEFACNFCKLNVHHEVKGNDQFCKPCLNFLKLKRIENTIARYSLPSLLLGLTIYFIPLFSIYRPIIPILAIIFFAPSLMSMGLIRMTIYRGIPEAQRITHMVVYFSKIKYNERMFYNKAEAIVMSDTEINDGLRDIILYYIVDKIMMDNKPNPTNFLENWSAGLGMDIEDMMQRMFEKTEIMDAFTVFSGVGVLPDIWPYIKNNTEIRNQVLEFLEKSIPDLVEATENERQYFLEDLYLIEEDLKEIVEEENKWHNLLAELDNFTPEEPPKNVLESFMAQANENARLMEQKKKSQQLSATQNPKE